MIPYIPDVSVFPARAGVILIQVLPWQGFHGLSRTSGGDPFGLPAAVMADLSFPHERG